MLRMDAVSFLKNVDRSDFDSFLRALAEELQLQSPHDMPEGLSQHRQPTRLADLAINRELGFVAARVTQVIAGQLQCLEAFHVRPDGHPPKVGLRLEGPSSAELTQAPGASPLISIVRDVKPSPRDLPHPRFHELSGLLCAQGSVQIMDVAQQQQLNELLNSLAHYSAVLSDVEAELRKQKAKVRALQSPRSQPDVLVTPDEQPVLEGLDTLPDWAANNSDRIVVLPRALNGAKKSRYIRPHLICEALMLLAGPYREHRCGRLSPERLEAVLAENSFKIEGSVGPSIAGELGDAYYVKFAGQRRFLDLHLLKGGGRDERYCMRIYFFWDADSSRVVCGHLPAHLPNSLS